MYYSRTNTCICSARWNKEEGMVPEGSDEMKTSDTNMKRKTLPDIETRRYIDGEWENSQKKCWK
jgi:hypothetical protein